jgi:hypothetical protein
MWGLQGTLPIIDTEKDPHGIAPSVDLFEATFAPRGAAFLDILSIRTGVGFVKSKTASKRHGILNDARK